MDAGGVEGACLDISCCELDAEQRGLCAAIEALYAHWGTSGMIYAVSALSETTTRAENVLARLAPQLGAYPFAVQLQLHGLRAVVCCAQEELKRAARFALRTIGHRLTQEGRSRARHALDAVFPTGTILSCPHCGEGLYKMTARCRTQDLVVDEGTLLTTLNRTIPARTAWTSLSCPLCGARLLKDGRIHTFQHGWL